MHTHKLPNLMLALLLAAAQSAPMAAQTQPIARRTSADDTSSKDKDQPKPNTAGGGATKADDAAVELRQALPLLPALTRGRDGLLNVSGQRATQNLMVTSTNMKDPVSDTFVFAGTLPLEAAEAVLIPSEQFTVTLPKFYSTVPALDQLSRSAWRFSLENPLLALVHRSNGVRGVRSATPTVTATGPLAGGAILLFESFGYRLNKSTIASALGGKNDTRYQSYDWNQHAELRTWRGHNFSARLALYSQDIDFATLSAMIQPEATPDFLARGGQIYFGDSYTSSGGNIVDSSLSTRKLKLRVLPRGANPMVLVEQGLVEGNYFDTVRQSASRTEWRESLRLRQRSAWGQHQLSFGGGFTRSAFALTRFGNRVILTGEEEDELASTTDFTGSPFESLSMHELTGWAEDKWTPARRVALTLGVKYDWGSVSRSNQWAPRFGFAVLAGENTVVRGGAGVFYDVMPMTVGTFTRSRRRVVQFFDEGVPETEPTALANILSSPHLKTPHVRGWNLEVDHRVSKDLLLRVRAEERRGTDLLLINPNHPGRDMAALILSNGATSRYRELEATASYRTTRWANLNASYVRSSGAGDLNTFTTTAGTFEKMFITGNRYARSRSDAPNRFLFWGDVRAPGGVMVMPAVDWHTGFPFAFVDADGNVPSEADFGRLPSTFTLDLGLYRDFSFRALDRAARLRLGVKVFNVTNHFNPREARLGENAAQTGAEVKGFLDAPPRSYRVSATFTF